MIKQLVCKPKKFFAFFNKQISDKYGQKCCRYNQNGKPLPKETVIQLKQTVEQFVNGWNFNENHTRLVKYFYVEDYPMAVQFLKDIAKMDALTTKNCPSFSLQKGQLLTLELYSPPIDGLSQIDFELAININRMNFDEYFLIPLKKNINYEREVQAFRLKKQRDTIQQELQKTQGINQQQATNTR